MLSKVKNIIKFIINMLNRYTSDSLISPLASYTSDENLDELTDWLDEKLKENESNSINNEMINGCKERDKK